MTADSDQATPQAPAYRSRWRRFSPSMGWKAFWSEILIVVLGVLIALAANEAAENWSWRNKVRESETRLKGDVDNLFQRAAQQYATTPCVEAQLQALTRNLIESRAKLTPAPVQSDAAGPRFVVRMPSRVWQFPVWEALVADGTATHFSKRWQDAYGNLNDAVRLLENTTEATRDLEKRLMVMTYPIDLDPQVRRDFLLDLEGLRMRNASLRLYSRQVMDNMVIDGIAPEPAQVNAYLKDTPAVKFCKQHGLPLEDWRDVLTLPDVVRPPVAR